MQRIIIRNQTNPLKSPLRVQFCRSFVERLRGLMFQPALAADSGALIDQQRDSRVDAAIHMFFVGFDLAAVWLDSNLRVVDLQLAKSWRPFYIPSRPARYILEIHPKRMEEFHIGDTIRFEQAASI